MYKDFYWLPVILSSFRQESTIRSQFVRFWLGTWGSLCTNPCRCGENVGKFEKRKIAKSLAIRGLAISFELNSYPEPGSNRHGLLHWCLRPTRLPIPPSGLAIALFLNCECKGKENLGNTHEESRFFLKKCRKKYIRASSKVKFAKEKPRQKKNRPRWL